MPEPSLVTSPAPLFADASDEGWTLLDNGVRRRVRLALPQMMMVEFDFPAGGVGAPHSHPHVQSSYVRSGVFDVTVAGQTRRLVAGAAFIVPPDAVHGVVAIEPGLLVDVFTPQREDFRSPP